MIEHTAPDLTELNSFDVLVVTSSEHFESRSKTDNSARRAVITPRTRLNSVKLPVEYCSGGSGVLRSRPKAHESTSMPLELRSRKSVPGSRMEGEELRCRLLPDFDAVFSDFFRRDCPFR